MNAQQFVYQLHFNDNGILNQQVQAMASVKFRSAERHRHLNLPSEGDSLPRQRMAKASFIT